MTEPTERGWTDTAIRKWWRSVGGEFFGPHVEHASIAEAKFLPAIPLALKAEGGWSSLALVERYAHLLPAGHEAAIRAFWGIYDAQRGSSSGAPA